MFRSSREGGGLFWKAADGTGQVERLKDGAARPYAWTADERLIFEQGQDIGVLTMAGGRTVEMLLDAESIETSPALSPDGRWLAYTTVGAGVGAGAGAGTPVTDVAPFPTIDDGLWNVSLTFGVAAMWSPDGRELFYRGPTGMMVAQIETEPAFSAQTPTLLFSVSDYPIGGLNGRNYNLAPDGDRFIFLRAETTAQTGDDEPLNGLLFVENWFEELKARVPIP